MCSRCRRSWTGWSEHCGRWARTAHERTTKIRSPRQTGQKHPYFWRMTPEEEKVWRAIQQKDRQVFESFYKEHYKFFFLAACKYLGDSGQAQEAVNDVFLRVWEDAERLAIRASLRSYLYR